MSPEEYFKITINIIEFFNFCQFVINQSNIEINNSISASKIVMMKSNTQKLLPSPYNLSQPLAQTQQVVFRDSKFIFYDNLQSSNKPFLQNKNSNSNNKQRNNIKYMRPQTGSTATFRPFRRQKTYNKNSITSKDSNIKDSMKINIKACTISKNSQNEFVNQSQKDRTRTSCMSSRKKEDITIKERSKTKNKSQIPQPASKNICVKAKNSSRFTTIQKVENSNNSVQIQQNRKNQNLNPKNRQKSITKTSTDKKRLKSNSDIKDINENKQQIKSEIKNSIQEDEINSLREAGSKQMNNLNDIRFLFGSHHILLKVNEDFLINSNLQKTQLRMNKNKKEDQLKIMDLIENSCEQNKLEEQLRRINYSQRSKLNNISQRFGNFSKYSQFNENNSAMIANSFVSEHGLERAPILTYLKNPQTKKLYNIMISQKPGLNSQYNYQFVDKQFNHENIQVVNGQQIRFIYIKPNPSVQLFPGNISASTIKHKQNIQNALTYANSYVSSPESKNGSQNNSIRQQLFVKFIKYIYLVDSEIVTRIFEPAINNVYSVWLFVNGCFEPVFVDGYFLLDDHLNHYYGDSGPFLWLPVLIKCICKVYNTYDKQILSRIKPQQVYKLLTGMDPILLPSHQISQMNSIQFHDLIVKHLTKGNLPLSFSNDSSNICLLKEDNKNKNIISYNYLSKQMQNFTVQKRSLENVILLPPFFNWFIYSFSIIGHSLNKLQLVCLRDIQIVFCFGNNNEHQLKRIYIYQSQYKINKKKCTKIKLSLKYECQIKNCLKHKLKRGNYRIFVQNGQKKMHLLFAGNKDSSDQTRQENNFTYNLSLLTSHEIKAKQVQQLSKIGDCVEDSQNIYQNCSFHRQSNKQNFQ